jgi:thiamine biosynthesis lipoprotein
MEAAARQSTLAASEREGYCSGEFTAMGSPCQLLSRAGLPIAQRQLEAVAAEAWRIEAKFSRYLSGNIVDRINSAAGKTVEVDEETANLLDFSATLHSLSGGLFDITSGVLREAWIFDGSDRVPRESAVRRAMRRVGWHRVSWDRPHLTMARDMQIDFGGVAKEYAVDKAVALAAALDDAPCKVNFGGDLAAAGAEGSETWMVGIESLHPGAGAPFRRVRLTRGALATSGDARRYLLKDGVRFGHILDPRTGWPVAGAPASVTVAADTCTIAGMLSTLAMLEGAGAERFLEGQGVRYWCIRPDPPGGPPAGP